jgi:hypothetical protein
MALQEVHIQKLDHLRYFFVGIMHIFPKLGARISYIFDLVEHCIPIHSYTCSFPAHQEYNWNRSRAKMTLQTTLSCKSIQAEKDLEHPESIHLQWK